ncbi:MAG: hypothetical protein JRC60_02990 [Deltaproteobacteria bacterium]|nr:hypothetical protein [Deltaproteobacteria bacterium]
MSSLTQQHQEWLENVMSDRSDRAFSKHGSVKEAREVLDWALAKLSAEDRMVLELVYLEGLTTKEAAKMLGQYDKDQRSAQHGVPGKGHGSYR